MNEQESRRGKRLSRLRFTFETFAKSEATSGILLITCALVALVWSNSSAAQSYFDLWQMPVGLEAGRFRIVEPLAHWINDGLMVLFFLLVGLEIKREMLSGELATFRQAALPVMAALGGMVVPALIYTALNGGGPARQGWGVPMATDIAFALGVLALIGNRVPLGLRVFVAAVAVADDLGAVIVIALFYSHDLQRSALVWAAVLFLALVVLNRLRVRKLAPYLVLGFFLWIAILNSGIHATIAGVLLALAVPDRRRLDAPGFTRVVRSLVDRLESDTARQDHGSADDAPGGDYLEAVSAMQIACNEVQSPLRTLEHFLVPWVNWLIMPLFALCNAGVSLRPSSGGGQAFDRSIAAGVVLGLVLGKPIGITVFSWLAVKLRLAALPGGVTWRVFMGAGMLCGIGFTMALFIAGLAFHDPAQLDSAKVAILGGSLVSAILGLVWLHRVAAGNAPATDAIDRTSSSSAN